MLAIDPVGLPCSLLLPFGEFHELLGVEEHLARDARYQTAEISGGT